MIEFSKTIQFDYLKDRFLYIGGKSLYPEFNIGFKFEKGYHYIDFEINLIFIRFYIGYN